MIVTFLAKLNLIAVRLNDGALQTPRDLRLRLDANNPVDLAPVLHDEQGRNTSYIEARCSDRILIDVQLCYPHASRHFRGQFLKHGSDHSTGATPGSPHVQEHGDRRPVDVSVESGVCNVEGMMIGREGSFALSANRLQSRVEFFLRNTIVRSTGGTTDELCCGHKVLDL